MKVTIAKIARTRATAATIAITILVGLVFLISDFIITTNKKERKKERKKET